MTLFPEKEKIPYRKAALKIPYQRIKGHYSSKMIKNKRIKRKIMSYSSNNNSSNHNNNNYNKNLDNSNKI
jgi:hypothetical protein